MRVHEVGIARSAPRGAPERGEHDRQQERLCRPATQVADDAAAVGDPEVAKRGRCDHLHLHSALANAFHRVLDEPPRRVTRKARVRRGEDCDFHRASERRPKTIGTESASMAKK